MDYSACRLKGRVSGKSCEILFDSKRANLSYIYFGKYRLEEWMRFFGICSYEIACDGSVEFWCMGVLNWSIYLPCNFLSSGVMSDTFIKNYLFTDVRVVLLIYYFN